MKVTKTSLLIIALVCGIQTLLAQNLSNRGKEFWVGYGHHQFMEPGQDNSQEMVLYLSAEQAANVTVTIEGTSYIRNYSVPANSVIASEYIPKSGASDARLISLPCSFVPPGFPCGGEGVFVNKGIHIVSDVPIVAYAHIFGSASSGASMLMPVETWGYSYISINSTQSYIPNCFSWVYAIAQNDNTLIEVTPAAVTRAGKAAGTPYTVTLMKGQIYQVMAGPESGNAKPEMTGTKIKSIANASGNCYPIAVFSGSSRTSNPMSCGSGGGDNDNQQCFPSQAWGKRYLTAPTSNSVTPATPMTNKYKIAVKDPATLVYKDGVLMTGIISNSYYEITSNEGHYITSNKPIMVAQFMSGGSCLGGGAGSVGDPEMIYISPLEQGIKRTGFYRNTRQGITVNYLTLIIPTAGVSSLTIDGSNVFNHTYIHPKLPGYTVVIKRWTSAQAQAVAKSDSAFTAITYGLGSVESYGYNAGTLINNLSAVGSIFNTSDTTGATSHPFTCNNTPVQLSVLIAYQPTKLVWQLSQLATVLSPNADVTVNSPVTTGTVTINGIVYYKYTLPGNYNFSNTGSYTVPLLSTHPSIENCNNTESLNYTIQVNNRPSVDFTFSHTGCIADPVQFTGPATTANGANINQWLWTYPGATTSNTQNSTHLFTSTGNQTVRLNAVTADGCVADTIKTIPIFARPVATITATPAAVCEGGTITLTGATTFGGSAPISTYYWNFGNGTATTVGPHTITYPASGTYNVKLVAGVSAACVSDTAVKIVQVSAKPNTTFTYPAGCLPANGVVQFTSTSAAPGQTYTWNFGDPASGASNTSTLANPSHTYPSFGNYTISYSVTNATGCTKDTTVNATFNLSPSFNYPALSPICESATGTVSVATATVTNGVPGSGVYHGPATSLAGVFTPSVAGAGTHTIWYVYSATSGCIDSVSQTIVVYPKPAANFTIASSTCLPASGTVQFNYSGSLSAGQTYAWNFGDPASGAANTSTLLNPTHNYTTGNYNINLVVTNAQGCVDDTTYAATFSRRASLAYPALSPVCVSAAGTVSVATATVTNGVTGTGVYSGPGTNAAGNFTPSIAGPGTHIIKYVFTATGNCVDSISSSITVFPKPTASFTYPLVCLPATGAAQFTYNGSAANSYAWNFGDPASGALNLSSLQNPTHNFTTAGTYPLSLTVSDVNACTDDTVINAVFNLKPALNYPTLPPVCSSAPGTISVSTATVTNGVSGTGIYSGPGTDAAGNFNPSTAGPGTHTIKYVFTATGNCKDSVSSTITVGAKPTASFTYSPTACLPTTGLVQFTYTGSAATSYAWNFGDPASGTANTSTLQNPSHTYSNTGSYNLSLIVTGANGCTDDTLLTKIFSVMPALNYPTLPPVCSSVPGTVSVSTATVTNGVSGSGVYSGPGTDAAGNFNPSIAGAGTHTIWYVFTSTGNCKDSVSSTITVGAKPTASFTYSPTACLPTNGLVQFTYTGSAATSYAWNFGDPASGASNTSTLQNPSHTYSNTGSYNLSLIVTGANGCTDDTLLTKIFSVMPALNYPPLATTCAGTPSISVATATVTNGVSGTGVYSGPGTDAAGNFNPSIAGAGTHTIWYVFTTTGNCIDSVSSTITVGAKPTASFTYSPTACLPTNGLVQFTYTGSAATSYAWNFGDPASGASNTSTLQNPSHTYSNTGSYNLSLIVTGANGCTDDTLLTKIFSVMPALNYPPLATTCAGTPSISVATATVTNGVSGTGVYSGPGTNAAGNFNPSIAGAGTHTIWYVFTSTGNCKDSVSSTITVGAKPTASFTYSPTACLPTNGLVQFTYTGSAATSYAWNFGDPASGTANSSTLQNPTHTYSNTGNYNISLTVTGANGCTDDTIITRTFSVTPALNYPPLPTACVGTSGTISVASATVTNGVSGTGVYSGPGTDAAGNFNAAVAGPGTHTIVYTFTSTGNCVATISSSITVRPKPTAVFTASANTCDDVDVLITDNSTISSGNIVSWKWNFGDNTNVTNTSNAPFTHNYAAPGTYIIKLVTVSDNGCVSDTAVQSVSVHAVPLANFTLPASVCMPDGDVAIQNTSSVSDNAALTYQWDFGDLGSSTARNPTHTYAASGSYDIRLTVTSQFGCTHDTVKTFSNFFDKPIAAFSVSPDSLCQGSPVTFTNASSAPNSTISTYLWILGDGTTAAVVNPVKTFAAGNFNVKLVVTSAEGCISDTVMHTVVVHEQPVIDAGPSFVVAEGTQIQLQGVSNSPAFTFLWSPASGLSDPTILNPTLLAISNTLYVLTATGNGNCTASDSLTVKVLKQVTIPNAFSPNGDGVNDFWQIDYLADYPGATVQVFNRYGQSVFNSLGYANPWDGNIKGKALPVATYYYIIDLKNGFKPLNGPITLIR